MLYGWEVTLAMRQRLDEMSTRLRSQWSTTIHLRLDVTTVPDHIPLYPTPTLNITYLLTYLHDNFSIMV